MFVLVWLFTLVGALLELIQVSPVAADSPQPIEVIEDNSFLIEEAYNQEAGVVQHIFTAQWGEDRNQHPHQRGWNLNFTQEWPIFSERHQFSYSIPFSFIREGGVPQDGVGDILLNYRLQVLKESQRVPAFAPRFSLILPTGSRNKGTGNGVVGYQWNLPFSKVLAPRLAMHVNLGLTYLPGVRVPIEPEPPSFHGLSAAHSLLSYNLGASAIVALFPRLHLMLEWIGTFEQNLNEQGKREHDFNVVISPGMRAAVVNRDELQVVLGIAAPVGLTRPAQDHAVFLYFSVEHNFL
ncbi:MAG: transporter [Deltaproteobacteria bacterium]|nr:transporter [Deltaproteobacteria bacterium]